MSHNSVPQECLTSVSHKSVLQESFLSHKSVPQKCPTRVSYTSFLQECLVRVTHKSVLQECLTECPTRVSHKSDRKSVVPPQECPRRLSHKSVPQECPTRVSYKSDPQKCPTRVSYKSVICTFWNVSAFGFVGSILFLFLCKRRRASRSSISRTGDCKRPHSDQRINSGATLRHPSTISPVACELPDRSSRGCLNKAGGCRLTRAGTRERGPARPRCSCAG